MYIYTSVSPCIKCTEKPWNRACKNTTYRIRVDSVPHMGDLRMYERSHEPFLHLVQWDRTCKHITGTCLGTWKILSFQGPGNWKESLNWKHDAESTFLSHDLGQFTKNMFNKRKTKKTVKPSGQKAVGFRHFAKREFETNEICSHALKPKNTCSIFKIQSSDQGSDAFPK